MKESIKLCVYHGIFINITGKHDGGETTEKIEASASNYTVQYFFQL